MLRHDTWQAYDRFDKILNINIFIALFTCDVCFVTATASRESFPSLNLS